MESETLLLAGRYRLDAVLGDGGMGRVWRAHDETLGRDVAVKEVVFPAHLTERERDALCERTMREAQVTAQLNHPAIVTTYDAVSEGDRPFVVMELVPSVNLSEHIERYGPLEPRSVQHIGLTVLDALATAHRQGVVHRDVKPSNILLADDGRVLLGDFGIAVRDSDPGLTTTGLLIGSPTYMSPERLRGERAGAPGDVWALGATLYAALEGHPPFRADTTMGTITAVLNDDVAPPHPRGPLADAVAGMLVKDPQRRLTLDQAREMLARPLEQESHATTMPAPAPARESRSPATPYRKRTWVAAALLVPALVVAGVFALSQLTGSDPSPPSAPSAEPAPPSPGPSEPGPTSPDATGGNGGNGGPESTTPASVPDGYRMHRDPLGFQVAVPQGWNRRLDGPSRVDFVAPSGDRFVRIDQRAQALPDAAEAWREAEPGVADRLDGYNRIRIEPVPHPRWDVADWEFTWQGGSGRIHVLNRGIATDTRGFALYVSAPHASWQSEGAPVFDTVSRTFSPS